MTQVARASERVKPVACEVCGASANTVHLLPDVSNPMLARFACPKHDLDGYWFYITADGRPKERWMLDHLAEKGAEPVIVYMQRLKREQERQRREMRAALRAGEHSQ
jgi:hypothetical protein